MGGPVIGPGELAAVETMNQGAVAWCVWSLAWCAIWCVLAAVAWPHPACAVYYLAPPHCGVWAAAGHWWLAMSSAGLAGVSLISAVLPLGYGPLTPR